MSANFPSVNPKPENLRHRWKVIARGDISRRDYVECARCGLYAIRGDAARAGIKCKATR